jgi:hypothetical protein
MSKTTSKSATRAAEFLAAAAEHGFTVQVSGDLVSILASFTPGDRDAYIAFDSASYSVLRLAPVVGVGRTWGTDSASVGGHAGLISGFYRMNKSGVSKRFVNAVAKANRS